MSSFLNFRSWQGPAIQCGSRKFVPVLPRREICCQLSCQLLKPFYGRFKKSFAIHQIGLGHIICGFKHKESSSLILWTKKSNTIINGHHFLVPTTVHLCDYCVFRWGNINKLKKLLNQSFCPAGLLPVQLPPRCRQVPREAASETRKQTKTAFSRQNFLKLTDNAKEITEIKHRCF